MTSRSSGGYRLVVEGLSEFRRELGRIQEEREWTTELRKTNKQAAGLIVDRAAPGMPLLSGRLAGSLRALAGQTHASVAVGNNTGVPYAGPILFGWPARNIEPQDPIYPAIADTFEEFEELYGDLIDDLTKRAFPEGSPSS